MSSELPDRTQGPGISKEFRPQCTPPAVAVAVAHDSSWSYFGSISQRGAETGCDVKYVDDCGASRIGIDCDSAALLTPAVAKLCSRRVRSRGVREVFSCKNAGLSVDAQVFCLDVFCESSEPCHPSLRGTLLFFAFPCLALRACESVRMQRMLSLLYMTPKEPLLSLSLLLPSLST